jgi:phosphatidylglycerophosphate synthase
MCQQGRGDRLSLATCDSRPILISGNWEALLALWQAGFPLGDISARLGGIEHSLPNEYFCAEIRKLVARDGDRLLLRTVGKATDRWHVVWVRNWSFPALRRLASVRVTPNQITVAGFLLALAACLVMARGGYWGGVCGAALLYLSWVLDCMDGTLARLTFAESDFGQRLDTVLGHVTNFAIFSALIWAVYGAASPWRTVLFAVGILGGITLAYRFSKEAKRLLPAAASTSSPPGQNMERFLDKINHRDYAVVIFVLALVQGFQVFLWLSLVGVQIFWLLQLRLIATRRNNLDPSVPQSLNP